MTPKSFIGEFEQMLLLAILRLGEDAYGPQVSRLLEDEADRSISRGALYSTLDRLERKGYLEWHIVAATSRRAGNRRRLFRVTPAGIRALAVSRDILLRLWRGLEGTLSTPDPAK